MTSASSTPHTLSHLLDGLRQAAAQTGSLSMSALVERLQGRGIGALMVFFSLLLALPSGIMPGLNTLFALPLAALSAQRALGHDKVWLPRRLKTKEWSAAQTDSMVAKLQPWLLRLEKLLKPRFAAITTPAGARLTGLLALIMALFASIPVPLTHTVPGFGLLLLSAGIVMHDGLAIIAGAVVGIGYITALITALIIFGPDAVHIIKHALSTL